MMKKLGVGLALLAATLVTAPRAADAFCGFYVSGADAKLFNNATHVVLMREGTRTVLSMQNNYQGPPSNFAMVVPVPVVLQEANVKTLESAVFNHIDQLSAPRLVEYWEQDPCMRMHEREGSMGGGRMAPTSRARPSDESKDKDLGVTVEAKFTVGEYQIVILSAKDSGGLDKWMRLENYKIPEGAQAYLEPYVQAGSKFFVAKVDVQKVKFENGMAKLSPLRFHYDTETFSLPVRLGLMNSAGKQDLIVNILAQGQRYEVANYPNASIPTNLEVSEAAKGQFGAFYAALFDRAIEKVPKAIITEYAWDARSCDPCPSPAMTTGELAILGGDVLPSAQAADDGQDSGGARRRRPSLSGFVLTRLHARYAKDSLGEDLVFRAAAPITGGREFRGSNGQLEKGALQQGGVNNFQGRYAVRHPWTGPVACKDPQRGIWGGPPGGGKVGLKPAQDIAFAPRGSFQLATAIKGGIPDIIALPGAVTPLGTPVVPVPPSKDPPKVATTDAGASIPSASSSDAGAAPAPPSVPPKQGGCGCDVPGTSSRDGIAYGGMFAGLALALAGLARRRR